MVGNMKYQWIGNYRTTRHKEFESSLNKKKTILSKKTWWFFQSINILYSCRNGEGYIEIIVNDLTLRKWYKAYE